MFFPPSILFMSLSCPIDDFIKKIYIYVKALHLLAIFSRFKQHNESLTCLFLYAYFTFRL